MLNVLAIRRIVGIIGNVISFGLFLSPVPTFVKIWKKKAVEQFSPIPYLATLLNCALWIFYGMPFISSNNTLVYTINGVGFALETIYIAIFFIYSPAQVKGKVLKFLAAETVFMAAVVAIVMLAVHTMAKRTLVVGILCLIFNLFMYASPFSVMKLVIQTKSVKYMPFFLSFVGALNGGCWLAYALLKFDVFLVIPNGAGMLLGLAQLVLYFCYYGSTPKDGEEEGKPRKKAEVQMT